MKIYKLSAQPVQAPPPAAPGQAQPQVQTQADQSKGIDLSQIQTEQQLPPQVVDEGVSKIRDFAEKWMIRNAQPVIEYMLDPTDQRRSALIQKAVEAATNESLGEVPLAGWLLKRIGIGKNLGNSRVAQAIGAQLVKYIEQTFNLGQIPDDVSRQNKLLQKYDLPDDVAKQLGGTIESVRQKYAGQPKVIAQFMTILLRIRDRLDLVGIQADLMRKASAKGFIAIG